MTKKSNQDPQLNKHGVTGSVYKILNLYACLGGNRYKWDEVAKEKDWHEAKHLVKIFDNYACDFAYWLSNDWLLDERWSKITEPKELLEIFKQENKL